jgi:hypothetical protein
MLKVFSGLAFALMISLVSFSPALAQATTGSVSGSVSDPNGAVVAGATVTLTNSATGQSRTVSTNDRGLFVAASMPIGSYRVSIEATGFKRATATDVSVEVTRETQLTFVLEVGLADEEVTVTSAQDVVNTSSPTITNVIDTRQVKDLPLPTRNPLDLAALQAGIAVIAGDTRNSSVQGLRGSSVNVTQDGINAMDNFVRTSSFFALSSPSLNSTAEFSITTGTTGSDAGRGAGQVNLVTRGGTNQLRGSLFYLHRNDAFNSNSFFNNLVGTPRAKQRQHFFGFDVGGPVFGPWFKDGKPDIWDGRDTAFFYFSYEGFRENFSATRNRTVLTPEARQGLFRYIQSGTGLTQTVNLYTVGNVGTPNPITTAILNAYPLPNNTLVGDGLNTAGFQWQVVGADVNDKFVFRYDHLLVKDSPVGTHKFEFVINRANFALKPDTFNGIESPFPGGPGAFQGSERWLLTGALVSTFGSATNVFRYGRQWSPVGFLLTSQLSAPQLVFGGITNTWPNLGGLPFLSQGRETTVNQFRDDFTLPRGNHLYRMGVDFQNVYAYTFNDAGVVQTITIGSNTANPTGLNQTLSFPGSSAGAFATAGAIYANLVGNLGSSAATLNVSSPTSGFVLGATRERIFRQRDLGVYVQDQWRVKNNLTLSYGVRWEFIGVPTIPNGLAIQLTNAFDVYGVSGKGNLFNPTAAAGAAPAIGTLDFVSGNTGIPLFKDDWNNFAPFIGVAYSPDFQDGFMRTLFGPLGKSSFRLGYSISYLKEGFTYISNAMGVGTTNPGLIQSAAVTTPTGVLTSAGVTLPIPSFTMPVTDRANTLFNPNNGLWAIDPDIRTPYVQQWNVGFEREIMKNTAIEVRYNGNLALKVWRANNINEVNIFENGFLAEFQRAQHNLAQRGGANFAPDSPSLPCATCLPTPLLTALFGSPVSSFYANSTFLSQLNLGNVGGMANTLRSSITFRPTRENPANGIASNFFVANPNALNALLTESSSSSNYHALQAELRRRFSGGLQFQAAYTFSKTITDTAGSLTNQSGNESYWTFRDKRIDRQRAGYDQRHRFVANSVYELPFGKGKSFLGDSGTLVDQLIGNWTVGGIMTFSTRPPLYVTSGRSTFNAFGSFAKLAPGVSFEEFKKNFGLYKTPQGVFYFNPDLLNITTSPTTGLAVQSSLKPGYLVAPSPGEWGDFPRDGISGPSYFNLDLSITKGIPIGERVRAELKTTMINALNHANFTYGSVTFDSTQFGRVTGQVGSVRIIHFTGTLRF